MKGTGDAEIMLRFVKIGFVLRNGDSILEICELDHSK